MSTITIIIGNDGETGPAVVSGGVFVLGPYGDVIGITNVGDDTRTTVGLEM